MHLGIEVRMALLLVGHPVAGVLVGLGAVAALVGRGIHVHVHVSLQDGLLGEPLPALLTAVGQLVPGRVRPQYVTYIQQHYAKIILNKFLINRYWYRYHVAVPGTAHGCRLKM